MILNVFIDTNPHCRSPLTGRVANCVVFNTLTSKPSLLSCKLVLFLSDFRRPRGRLITLAEFRPNGLSLISAVNKNFLSFFATPLTNFSHHLSKVAISIFLPNDLLLQYQRLGESWNLGKKNGLLFHSNCLSLECKKPMQLTIYRAGIEDVEEEWKMREFESKMSSVVGLGSLVSDYTVVAELEAVGTSVVSLGVAVGVARGVECFEAYSRLATLSSDALIRTDSKLFQS